jgi:hypothetical protein
MSQRMSPTTSMRPPRKLTVQFIATVSVLSVRGRQAAQPEPTAFFFLEGQRFNSESLAFDAHIDLDRW